MPLWQPALPGPEAGPFMRLTGRVLCCQPSHWKKSCSVALEAHWRLRGLVELDVLSVPLVPKLRSWLTGGPWKPSKGPSAQCGLTVFPLLGTAAQETVQAGVENNYMHLLGYLNKLNGLALVIFPFPAASCLYFTKIQRWYYSLYRPSFIWNQPGLVVTLEI